MPQTGRNDETGGAIETTTCRGAGGATRRGPHATGADAAGVIH